MGHYCAQTITNPPIPVWATKEAPWQLKTQRLPISAEVRIDFDLVRGDYLTITATVSAGLCDVVIAWGEAI